MKKKKKRKKKKKKKKKREEKTEQKNVYTFESSVSHKYRTLNRKCYEKLSISKFINCTENINYHGNKKKVNR